jgi:hypothetical protein
MKKPSKASQAATKMAVDYLYATRRYENVYDIEKATYYLALDIDRLAAVRVKQATKKKAKVKK